MDRPNQRVTLVTVRLWRLWVAKGANLSSQTGRPQIVRFGARFLGITGLAPTDLT